MREDRRLWAGARWVRVMVVVVMRLVRVLQLPVLANELFHFPFQLVYPLPLRLNQTLLVLNDGRQFFQIEDSFHWII